MLLRKKKRKLRAMLTCFLCAVMLAAGPVYPMQAYAAYESDDYNDYADDDDQDVDEPGSNTASSSTNSVIANYENQISQLDKRLESLEAEKKEREQALAETKDEKARAVQEQQQLDWQIATTRDEISLLEERIALLESQIEQKLVDIDIKQDEIDANYELLKKRLRAMYMQDDSTLLGLVLGADSFADFLTRTEYVVRIAEHDRNLMATLTEERIEIEQDKADLEVAKLRVEDDKVATEGKKQELSKQYAAAALRVQDMEEMERQFQADIEKYSAMMAQVQSEIKDIYQKIEWSKNPYVGGEMLWPLPGYSQISSNFGSRFGGSDYHTGVDITGAGVFGSTIVAANSGTVKFTQTSFVDGQGYGIYLIIDHGGGMSTLYAHCSSLLVGVGTEVNRGDAIALVGSTGWSTGPHLHFEVRKDGTAQSPLPYLQG